MSYCRFSSDGWRSDVYVYADVSGGYQCWLAANRRDGLDQLADESYPDSRSINVDTGEWLEAWARWLAAHNANMELLGTLPVVPFKHGLGNGHHTGTAAEMADWLEQVARPEGLHVPQDAIDGLRDEVDEC